MENAVDKNFDKLEIWVLRNVFALGRGKGEEGELANWVRLGHYEVCIHCILHVSPRMCGTRFGRVLTWTCSGHGMRHMEG